MVWFAVWAICAFIGAAFAGAKGRGDLAFLAVLGAVVLIVWGAVQISPKALQASPAGSISPYDLTRFKADIRATPWLSESDYTVLEYGARRVLERNLCSEVRGGDNAVDDPSVYWIKCTFPKQVAFRYVDANHDIEVCGSVAAQCFR